MKASAHLELHSTLSDDERRLAREVSQLIRRSEGPLKLSGTDGKEFPVPEGLSKVLAQAADLMGEGSTIAIFEHQTELTPRQAAELLNISRPYLVTLLDRGDIPFRRVGTHRRVQLSDVLEYKQRRDRERDDHLRRLSELGREFGIPE